MTLKNYQHFLRIANQHTRVAAEAEDLLQDALLVAVEQGRLDLDAEENIKWIAGIIRKKGAMQARSAVRRKKRDADYSMESVQENALDPSNKNAVRAPANKEAGHFSEELLDSLSSANRTVAILALHGLTRKEICIALNISDTAFRQRLTAIRRALGPLPGELQQEAVAMAYASRQTRGKEYGSDLPLGLLRRALMHQLNTLKNNGIRGIGTYDPSGHLIVFEQKK